MNMQEIVGIDIDYSKLPKDWLNSKHPEAIKFRAAHARASNAIEGVVLSQADKDFMDSIPLDISKADFKKAVLKHIEKSRV